MIEEATPLKTWQIISSMRRILTDALLARFHSLLLDSKATVEQVRDARQTAKQELDQDYEMLLRGRA